MSDEDISEVLIRFDGNGLFSRSWISVMAVLNNRERVSCECPQSSNCWKSRVVNSMKSDCSVFCL